MTSNEAKMILFESLLHSKNTKVDFFINKQKEIGITPLNYISDLVDEYENLYERVNTVTHKSWEIDEITKKKKYHKQTILLNTETNGLMCGQIDCNNIFEIGEPLLEYGRLIQNKSQKKKSQKKTSYLWLNNPDKELPELFSLMINKKNLISSDTTYEQFKAVFTGQPIQSINPIKWNATKSLNAYFIEQLINKNKLSKAINTDIWEISKYCFSKGTNFSQLIDNYNNSKTGKPKNYNLIDDLLNAL